MNVLFILLLLLLLLLLSLLLFCFFMLLHRKFHKKWLSIRWKPSGHSPSQNILRLICEIEWSRAFVESLITDFVQCSSDVA